MCDRVFHRLKQEIAQARYKYGKDIPFKQMAVMIPATSAFIDALQEEIDPYTLWAFLCENNITITREVKGLPHFKMILEKEGV